MTHPTSDRPWLPDGYGLPATDDGLLDWSAVEERLVASHHYWLATTRPDGRPHVVPRWGVWLDGRFWYDGAPTTIHVRNLNGDNHCALHLEDGSEAVIVEGRSDVAPPPGPELGQRLSAAFTEKYADRGYSPAADAWDGQDSGGLRVLTPIKAMAWFNFPSDVTRFRFAAD
ncbi:MAG: pyridoxamine 5'-phosphate oxidase family protein [Acidimicrobiia bacterium]|nr:pyridoxamine 5'-phosphate oxidase family protein [Acidimicrobiia bacterium]